MVADAGSHAARAMVSDYGGHLEIDLMVFNLMLVVLGDAKTGFISLDFSSLFIRLSSSRLFFLFLSSSIVFKVVVLV